MRNVWKGSEVEMKTKKIIDGLYFTIGMMLFNPTTGETKTPNELNEDDRYTYDACMGAIEALKVREPVRPGIGIIHNDDGSKSYFLHCPLDGTIFDEGDKYCRKCGRVVKWE